MTAVYVEAVGIFAPGLEGWQASKSVLAGESKYTQEPLPKYKPLLLPANERRRASAVVRLAFGACENVVGDRLEEASKLGAVFASSGGDYGINDQISRAVLAEEKAVSPTQFHNSVHNAAAGYWGIASKSQATSISLSGCDFSVATGLLEAQALISVEQLPLLLVFSDVAVVPPMNAKRPVNHPFAAALWLTPQQTANTFARLNLQLIPAGEPKRAVTNQLSNRDLELLLNDNPAARILPVLELLAKEQSGTVLIQMAGSQTLQVSVTRVD
jgi:hypothetical protein